MNLETPPMSRTNRQPRIGRQKRRESRLRAPIVQAKTLVMNVPLYEVGSPEAVELIHETAMRILEEVGVQFVDEETLSLWREAGADVSGDRVKIARELLLPLIASAPEEFTLHARNAQNSVKIGGRHIVFHPPGGAYIRDLDGVRRRSTLADLETIVKLTHCLSPLHLSTGWPAIDLSDVPVPARHLHQIYCPLNLTDKPLTANSYSRESAEDAIEMCRRFRTWCS